MVGQFIPHDDEFWENFLVLLDLLLAPEITEDETAHLESLIFEHHAQFIELYPEASVIPKMHFMVHMPRIIRQ